MQSIAKEMAQLRQMSIPALKSRYAELFNEACRANNKAWLIKRITWCLQAPAEGDLPERARQRAAEIANDADLRLSPARPKRAAKPAPELTLAEQTIAGIGLRLMVDHLQGSAHVALDVLLENAQVHLVCLERKVENVADDWDQADQEVQGIVANHKSHLVLW